MTRDKIYWKYHDEVEKIVQETLNTQKPIASTEKNNKSLNLSMSRGRVRMKNLARKRRELRTSLYQRKRLQEKFKLRYPARVLP